jgi:hypothetical protein
MSSFVNFKRCLVELGNYQIYATSANLSLNTSLARDTRLIGYSQDTAGATINDPRLVPTAGVKGTVSFDFVISSQHFSRDANGKNTIADIFELNRQMSPELTKVGRIGNYRFYNAGLKSFSFNMKPFSLITASAEYEIFGSVSEVVDKALPVDDVNPAEGLKSFGSATANGMTLNDSSTFDVQLISANYRVQATRKFNYTIRANEHPVTKFVPGAMMPYRVSLSTVTIDCSVNSNKIIPNLNEYGNMQNSFDSFDMSEVELSLNLFEARSASNVRGTDSGHLAEFKCIGAVTSQNLSVDSGSYLSGDFNIQQVLK